MIINMNDSSINRIEDIREFLNTSEKISFGKESSAQVYEWMEQLLVRFRYIQLRKPDKGLVKQYIEKITGYSRAQTTRLIKQYVKTGHIVLNTKSVKRHKFKKKYSTEEVRLVAQTALVHNNPNGMALKSFLGRAYDIYGDVRFKTIKNISVSYLYVMVQTTTFKRIAGDYEKTKPTVSNIGERRKPRPNGKPGYLRVDSVHQGDMDGVKGVYHIDIVDEVTQWQCVISVPEISSKYMTLALETLMKVFPFKIYEIHTDNGSEYINKNIANMLTHLLIQLTKSRARHCNDNALCESKHNIIRKWIGYSFMGKDMYEDLNEFHKVFNEYLNYHRCCLFSVDEESKTKLGKIIKKYKQENCITPLTKLRSLPNFEQYLKSNVTVESLDVLERKHTDYQMAEIVQEKLATLYKVLMHVTTPVFSGSSID